MRRVDLPLSTLRSRINIFCLLAFVPLLLIVYYKFASGYSILSVLIPFYGFLLLFLKRDRLSLFAEPGGMQRFVGLTVMLASFVAYSAVVYVYPLDLHGAGEAFYAVYVLGLFLTFFDVRALRECLSVLFLVVAGGFSFYLGEWLEAYMEPFVPQFVQGMVIVLVLLGLPAAVHSPRVIVLNASSEPVTVAFEAGCIGIYGPLAFSVIVIVMMMEESARLRTKILWSVGGVVGMFLVNIIRVSLISAVIYFFGYERWGEIHSWIGYALLLSWLMVFLILFSNRGAIQDKIRGFREKF